MLTERNREKPLNEDKVDEQGNQIISFSWAHRKHWMMTHTTLEKFLKNSL